jgi:hypothetical protein
MMIVVGLVAGVGVGAGVSGGKVEHAARTTVMLRARAPRGNMPTS